MDAPNYYLFLDSYTVGAPISRATKLSREIEKWLQSLDADQIRRAYEDGTWIDLETFEFISTDGWHLRFRPWPLQQGAARPKGSSVVGGSGPGEARLVDHLTPLHERLVNKLSAYGRLHCPYVIAILDLRLCATSTPDVDEALFGRDGFLSGGGRRSTSNVSGVLIGWHLVPESVGSVGPVIWSNPAADYPLPDLSWETRTHDSLLDSVRVAELGKLPAALFGLSEEWPGPERPFR